MTGKTIVSGKSLEQRGRGFEIANQRHSAQHMKRSTKIALTVTILLTPIFVLLAITWRSSLIERLPFQAPTASYQNWDDILANPQAITINTYSTGMMQTPLSAIMNLDHELAQDIEDEEIAFPVNVYVIDHQAFGTYLIDAGLDASYVDNPYGTLEGVMVESKSGRGSQQPGTDIAAILQRENVKIQGVWLTHLHPDHTPGILDLPKDIPYVVGKGERYINFKFFLHGGHLDGLDALYEIDFASGIDLPPLGKSIDVLGDGSLWAIAASGHSDGHVMYFINGIEDKVLVTGDACNTAHQFDSGIGPGYYSNDLEQAQETLDRIIAFKAAYPKVELVFGHDLQSR